MKYDYDLVLKRAPLNRWQLVTPAGVIFHEFMAKNKVDAEKTAREYMSSWTSVRITVEEKNNGEC